MKALVEGGDSSRFKPFNLQELGHGRISECASLEHFISMEGNLAVDHTRELSGAACLYLLNHSAPKWPAKSHVSGFPLLLTARCRTKLTKIDYDDLKLGQPVIIGSD